MLVLELVALAIVVLFVVVRARYGDAPRTFLWRLTVLVVGSWVVEDTCIRAYGFYSYHPSWSLFVDRVPLAILLIWPVVIHSAWELGQRLLSRGHRLVPLVGGALVLADASMIEPIAVESGLWVWTEPGLFAVPPIGIIGWAYYAALCMLVFERNSAAERTAAWDLVAVVLAPIATHLLLLASWWGLFRWVNVSLPPWPFVVAAWGMSLVLTYRAVTTGARRRVLPRDMLSRVPAALFFFTLLVIHGREVPALIVWALAFAPPYLALTRLASDEAAAA